MTPIVNLHILARIFTQLSRSAFFDPAFRKFASRTADVINHVLEDETRYPDAVVREFERQVWRVMRFVRGSRAKDAPHETQYALQKALSHWIKDKDVLISSAALEEFNFFLAPEDIWEFVSRSIDHFDRKNYGPLVVRIGSPEAFKHRPLFCIPLFHELGHFVDHYFEISKLSLIIFPPAPPPINMPLDYWREINLRHRMEYFADLFGACYCGEATNSSLNAIAPYNPDSATHPSTAKRLNVVREFLSGKQNRMVDMLQVACKARTGQILSVKSTVPTINTSFDDVLTYNINSEAELFGLFQSGWTYLEENLKNRIAPWIDKQTTIPDIERTVNDLIEKSLRNYEIKERWSNGTNNSI